MKLSKALALSLEIMVAHPLRTLLSVVGIVVGVAAVVVMVAAGRGAEESIAASIRSMGTNLIVVNAGRTEIRAGRPRQVGNVTTLVPEDAEAIPGRCPSVARAAPAVSTKMTLRFEDATATTTVVGTTFDGLAIRNLVQAEGRAFDQDEERAMMRVALLGPTVAANLFGDLAPLGQRFRVGRVPFEVVGVLAPKGLDANGVDQDDIVVVPLRTAMRRVLSITHVHSLYVQAIDGAALDRAEAEIRILLRERHRLGDRSDDFTIQNQAALLATERETSRSLTALIGSVAAISLFVGGVGILAVMLISVRERTAEIGLRRALGARRADIRRQFLFESAILAVAGAAFGVILGLAGAFALSRFSSWATLVSWPATFGAVFFSMLLGVLFGSYPAARAARLEPVAALRAE